jgi:phosphoribosylformimino-5-aminoimidazole carboxamide ribotide isomerase
MVQAVPTPIVASGGIASADDILRVATTGAAGCIVGRALYEGAVTIGSAVEAANDAS